MPQNWKTYTFGDLYNVSSGLSKSRDQFGFGSPFVTFKNVFYNYFLPSELSELANTNTKEQKSCSIKRGDIFLTRTSETLHELGMSSVALKDYPTATFNGFCKRLRLKDNIEVQVDPVYIGYYLRTSYFRNEVSKHSTMTTRASLNTSSINSLTVILPTIEEQIGIGEILKVLDGKIELNLQMNKTLEEMAMCLYKHWFVDFGPFQEGEFVESELGMIPKGWEVKRLEDIGEVIDSLHRTPTYSETGFSMVRVTDVKVGFLDLAKTFKVSENVFNEFSKKHSPSIGDIIMTRVGTYGVCSYVGTTDKFCIGQNTIVIVSRKINSSILYTALISPLIKSQIEEQVTGSTQKTISLKSINALKFILPIDLSSTDMNKPIKKLTAWYSLRSQLSEEIKTLTILRDTLLPKLISGEVRVKEAEEILEEVM